MIIEILILVNYKQSFQIIIKTDFFDYINNKVFFQLDKNRLLYLTAFFLKNANFF